MERKISLIVPLYNEIDNIENFSLQADSYSEMIGELIFVNDASNDATPEEIYSKIKCNIPFKLVNLLNNVGKDRAVLAGLELSEYEYTGIIDIDLQVSFKEIEKLLNRLEKKSLDIVIGIRENYHCFWNSFFRILARIAGLSQYMGNVSDFFVGKTELVKKVLLKYKNNPVFSLKGVIFEMTPRTGFQKIYVNPRNIGKSKMDFKKLLEIFNSTFVLSFPNLVSFSFIISMSLFSYLFVYIIYFFISSSRKKFQTPAFTLISSLAFQFFFLGVINEYLSPVIKHFIIQKPYFFVDSVISSRDK